MAKGKTGRRNRGSNKHFFNVYKLEHRHEKSHVRRIKNHLKAHPADKSPLEALAKYKLAGGIA
jgi:hypothetical protein